VALNCTIRNVSENTIPVSAIIPEAIDEQTDMAEAALMVDTRSGRKKCSMRGKVPPTSRDMKV
jgi:hypothetical protein